MRLERNSTVVLLYSDLWREQGKVVGTGAGESFGFDTCLNFVLLWLMVLNSIIYQVRFKSFPIVYSSFEASIIDLVSVV